MHARFRDNQAGKDVRSVPLTLSLILTSHCHCSVSYPSIERGMLREGLRDMGRIGKQSLCAGDFLLWETLNGETGGKFRVIV